jgi:hypothetical protein
MENEQLVQRKNGLELLNKTFLTASQQTLAVELNLTALNAKTAPERELVQEFSREFASDKPEVLQWAFREHRRQSQFFPTIAEIATLVAHKRRELREAAEAERERLERAESDKARAEGKTVSFAEIMEMIRAKLKRIPDSPALAKWHRLHEAPRRSHTGPAVILTPEEIRASVERERNDPRCQAELEHYREMYGG